MFTQGTYLTFQGSSPVTHNPNYRLQPPSQPSSSSSLGHGPIPPMPHPTQQHGTQLIGSSVYFSTGQFVGQTIRMELYEIQKADLGRKYARVDRRPLDPPPVVQLRIFSVQNVDTDEETEKELDYNEVEVLGFLCTVDLFPVPGPESGQPSPEHSPKASSVPATQPALSLSSSPQSASSPYAANPFRGHPPMGSPPRTRQGYQFVSESRSPESGSGPEDANSSTCAEHSANHFSGYILPSHPPADIVHRLNDFPIAESSKQTQALVGATFVQPALIDYQGSKAIVFVFADLAVKIEGSFILRYRVFDIFSRPYSQQSDLSVTAECYGAAFRVYSTKEFPGLSASTELTKHLARWGVRLNIRETERKRRKRGDRSSSPIGDED